MIVTVSGWLPSKYSGRPSSHSNDDRSTFAR